MPSPNHRTQHPFCASAADRRSRVAGLSGVLLVVGLAGWIGYGLGMNASSARGALSISNELAVGPDSRLNRLEGERQRTQAELDTMGQRLGQLQGEILRLNALGERLVQMARLDPEEFDFEHVPPMGGPAGSDFTRTDAGDLIRDVDSLARLLDDRGRKLDLLGDLLKHRELEDRTLPAGMPVHSGWVSSLFGTRRDPLTGRAAFHQGIDFVAKLGSEVVAVADGVVEHSGWRNGYGRTVEIRHPGGLLTRYAHNQKLMVETGAIVRQGQGIATVGASGRTTGAHLHFEVLKDGEPVDPSNYVRISERLADGNS
jgi:murein DD-endopeptidase MepM/ murein hydrolase activator NlpD